jgi:periplasmic protein TonB
VSAKAISSAPLSLDDLAPPPGGNQILPVAIALSLVAHAALLLVKFVPPDGRLFENFNAPMEVVLVNSKSAQKPVKADALAQANLDGGGNTEEDRRAKTNLPAIAESTTSEMSVAAERIEQLETEVQRMLTQLNSDYRAEAPADAAKQPQTRLEGKEPMEVDQRRLEIQKLEAQIARQMDQYQKLPKRKFIGARTEGVVYAQYVDEWRQKIERIGTRNFPDEAKRQGIFGSLLLTVSIRADGTVEKVDIERSSGYEVLDRAARRVVQLAGPFSPFPPAIRKEYDILSITRSWSFTRAEELVSE